MVAGCPVTGSADWLPGLLEVWRSVAQDLSVVVDPPTVAFLEQYRYPLLAALIPVALVAQFPPAFVADRTPFLRRFHLAVAAQLAERLRRREAHIAQSTTPPATSSAPPHYARQLQSCALPPERQLQTEDLRRLEVQRRNAPAPQHTTLLSRATHFGTHRQRWLRQRLMRLLLEETTACTQQLASSALVLLALFELD